MNHPVEIPKRKPHDYDKYPPVGIDLGTTNSTAAYFINSINRGAYDYVFNGKGFEDRPKLFPSLVYYDETEEDGPIFLTGRGAYGRRVIEPEKTAVAVKRKIGEAEEAFTLAGRKFTSIELLRKMVVGMITDLLSGGLEAPAGIVVTVPYYFHQNQNHHTRLAVEGALSDVFGKMEQEKRPELLALLPEPIAASIYYTMDTANFVVDRNILVFDLGGGTLDITIFKLQINDRKISFEVLSSTGDARLGGEDFDQLLEDYLIEEMEVSFNGLSEQQQKIQYSKIRREVIRAKEILSTVERTELVASNLPNGTHLECALKRSDFERLLAGNNKNGRNYIKDIASLLERGLEKAGLSAGEVNTLIFIGGSTRIPLIQKLVKNTFAKATIIDNPEYIYYAVSRGAAIYSAYLLDKDKGHTHFPFYRQVDYVEFVIRTSHNLGVETQNRQFSIIVPENQKVPVQETQYYCPLYYTDDSREKVALQVNVYQGDAQKVVNNSLIGTIKIPEIYTHGRSIEKDEVEVEITFHVSETIVKVDVHVPQGLPDKQDLHFEEHIHLEQKK